MCVCVYLLLCGDGELVAGDQAGHLLHAQIEELFTPNHLSEMLLCHEKNYFVTADEHNFFFSFCLFSTCSLIKPVLILSHPLSRCPLGHTQTHFSGAIRAAHTRIQK